MSEKIVTLDVRDDIRGGREPFGKIMQAVARLQPDEKLMLYAPFEPVPLFRVLRSQGFSHTATQTHSGEWQVLFERQAGANAADAGGDACGGCAPTIEVDARGIEPPGPMVRILETLSQLPCGATLKARTDLRPMHLYPQLEARGFRGETSEEDDGSFVTYIRRG